MKKPILILLAASLALNAVAQNTSKAVNKTGYLRFGFGYATKLNGQTSIGEENASGSLNSGSSSVSYAVKSASLGAGVNAVAAIGAMPHPNVGFELAVSVGLAPTKYTLDITVPDTKGSVVTHAKRPVIIMPSVVFQAGERRTQIYGRMGLALPLNARMIQEGSGVHSGTQPYSFNYVSETKSRFAIGFQGAVGVKVQLKDRMNFWAEANAVSLSTFAKSSTFTSYTIDGVEYLDQLPATLKSTEYEFEGTLHPAGNPTGKAATFSIPFSNAGISVGLSFKI